MGLFTASRPAPGTSLALGLGTCVGLLGAWPRSDGVDPLALIAWLGIVAAGVGFACGASGARLFPWGLAVPAAWMIALVQVDLASERDVVGPVWAGLAWSGLYAAGLGLGAFASPVDATRAPRPEIAWGGAGVLVLLALALAGGPVGGALGTGGPAWGSAQLCAALTRVSPTGLLLDCAGWDWTHANPLVYRLSGVEWIPHRPWDPKLAGPLVCVVGCLLAVALPPLRRSPNP